MPSTSTSSSMEDIKLCRRSTVGNWPDDDDEEEEEEEEETEIPSSAAAEISSCGSVTPGNVPPLFDKLSPQRLLLFAAGLLFRAVSFQIDLLIRSFAVPIWLSRCLPDPFRWLKYCSWRASSAFCNNTSMGKQRSVMSLLVRGCFWSSCVCFALVGLLAAAFLAGGLLTRRVAVGPVRLREDLRFDYGKASPEAVVTLASCGGAAYGLNCDGKNGLWKRPGRRLVPPGHKLKLGVSLTLPESDYNRKLGVFQVRADFLSQDGQVIAATSNPCMLRYKSPPMRFLEIFLRSGSLLVGYSLESQVINLEMTSFVEGTEPTAFIRVALEQRAEYKASAGIPEIYGASLTLDSELPLVKKTIWNWKWTLFIWSSMGFFLSELSIVLVCCRAAIIIPRTKSRYTSSKKISLQGLVKA